MAKKSAVPLLLITPIFILLSHYLAMFIHEYSHSIMAWVTGFKSNPLALNYGDSSWQNILYLANVNENVNYETIYAAGRNFFVALIAFAGAGIGNGIGYFLSLYLLNKPSIQQKTYWFYFLVWFNLMNIGNFYA